MIIECKNGEKLDTARLSPEERHVIQKLLAWHSLANSMDFFREKTGQAMLAGWNNSGPVPRTRALDLVVETLEWTLRQRLAVKTP